MDAGCGAYYPHLRHSFPKGQIILVESETRMCQYARDIYKVPPKSIEQCPAKLFTWSDYEDRCNLILAWDVLCYLDDEQVEHFMMRSPVALQKYKPSFYIISVPVALVDTKKDFNGKEMTLRTKEFYEKLFSKHRLT